MIIGSHVGMSGDKMFLGSVETAINNDADTLMIYTGAPQNTKRKSIDQLRIQEGQDLMKRHQINKLVIHAPYIVNLGNTVKPENLKFAINFLKEEIRRSDALGADQLVLHPGAHVGEGSEVAIKQISDSLNKIIDADQHVKIALETMAGKGTEVAKNFQQVQSIIDKVNLKDKISVCLDTCHIHDAGYDVKDNFEKVMQEFDQIIGIDKIGVVHLNDSKNPIDSHKDRHENIGAGYIGFESLTKIAHSTYFEKLPIILETPMVVRDDKKISPYKQEIKMLRSQKLESNWQSNIK